MSITLIKGDDTDWNGEQPFEISIQTEYDLSDGFKAEFILCEVKKSFPSIQDNKLYPKFSHKDTARFVLGDVFATLRILDEHDRVRTVKSDIPFTIVEGQFGQDPTTQVEPQEPITIVRGDDTNWNDEQTFTINLISELDLTQFKAQFIIGPIVKNFDSVVDNKIQPILTHPDTLKLTLGPARGIVKLIDQQGRIKTIASGIPFLVKRGVYSTTSATATALPTAEINTNLTQVTPSSIDITVANLIDYADIGNKPRINGVELNGDKTSEELGLQGQFIAGENITIEDNVISAQSSDAHFVFEQGIPSTVWSITHNLNKFPAVVVVDSAGQTVLCGVSYIDENNLQINFNGEFSGKAYLN